MNYSILLTFDVEDWFQVENFKQYIPFSSWPNCELRVEKNVHKILDLLESIKLNNSTNSSREMRSLFHWDPTNSTNSINPIASRLPPNGLNSSPCATRSAPYGLSSPPPAFRLASNEKDSLCSMRSAPCEPVKATFFVLGWIAKRLPNLVREIQTRDHEIASHGYDHVLCREQSAEDLKNDLLKSKKLLEDITGAPIYGYRAPGFSVNRDILSLIEGAGYLYDSSFNSFRLNKRYGQIELNGNNGYGILHKISDSFYEFPITNLKIGRQVLPWGGGGYFRLIPTGLFRLGVRSILKKHGGYIFYMHPWEIDASQPRVNKVRMSYRFRHYTNLARTLEKFRSFMGTFANCSFQACYQYLKSHEIGNI